MFFTTVETADARLQRAPRHVRREQDILAPDETRKRMPVAKRLGRIDIAGKAAEPACKHRIGNRRLVRDRAARHIDEDGVRLHPRKLPRADQPACAVAQRRVQGNNVGLFKQLVERHAAKCVGRRALVGKYAAAECLCHARYL